MKSNPSVNRCLDDMPMDLVDHALGRPLFPLQGTARNYFATVADGLQAIEFGASPLWELGIVRGDMAYFGVTDAGRRALAEHLETLDRPWRGFAITFAGHTSVVPARSREEAKYRHWLGVSDAMPDLSFMEFCRRTSVRRAA